MKRKLKLMAAMLIAIHSVKGQTEKGRNLFDENTQFLDLKVSVGSPFWGSINNKLPVVPHINYEIAISDAISTGGTLAYSSARENFLGVNLRYTAIYLGGRGAWHFYTRPKLDTYAGVSAGYIIVTLSDKSYAASYTSEVGLGAFAGIRYALANKVAINAELGYSGLSILTVGASLKL